MTRRPVRARAEDGAAAVEFALLFPLFLLIVFGVINMGFGFNQKINLTQAAREASRYGATLSIKASAPGNSGTITTWLQKVTDVAISAGGHDLEASRPNRYVCVAHVSSTGTVTSQVTGTGGPASSALCFADGRTDARVQIVVRSQTLVDFVFWGGAIDVGGESVTHFEAVPT
ncbi:MAG TPA: TadE/TadG family type IV pilus assembly protein [Mycobacteriales bacterium]|jgi:Flp pilus assembly protein TadG